jgi:hypothetical protein
MSALRLRSTVSGERAAAGSTLSLCIVPRELWWSGLDTRHTFDESGVSQSVHAAVFRASSGLTITRFRASGVVAQCCYSDNLYYQSIINFHRNWWS